MDWITTSWTDLGWSLLTSVIMYAALIAYTRLIGLRSFAKMSAPDFAMTIALGSLLATAVSAPGPALLLALPLMLFLFGLQWFAGWLRLRGGDVIIDNEPLLLMAGSEIIHEHLEKAEVTLADLRGKLREANVLRYEQVAAVVLEATGDISVLHHDGDDALDPDLLEGVRGVERLTSTQAA